MDKSIADILGSVSSTAQGARKAADIVAALAPPPSTAMTKADDASQSPTKAVLAFVPGVIGMGVGALVWKKHRVLGLLLGHAVVGNAVPIFRGGVERKRGLCRLGIEVSGVAGSLMWEDQPILGWIGGIAVGAAATAFVPGSPVNELYKKWRASR